MSSIVPLKEVKKTGAMRMLLGLFTPTTTKIVKHSQLEVLFFDGPQSIKVKYLSAVVGSSTKVRLEAMSCRCLIRSRKRSFQSFDVVGSTSWEDSHILQRDPM